jgi:hypothetical protein
MQENIVYTDNTGQTHTIDNRILDIKIEEGYSFPSDEKFFKYMREKTMSSSFSKLLSLDGTENYDFNLIGSEKSIYLIEFSFIAMTRADDGFFGFSFNKVSSKEEVLNNIHEFLKKNKAKLLDINPSRNSFIKIHKYC